MTLFGIFLTPVFYDVIQWYEDRRAQHPGKFLNVAPAHEHMPEHSHQAG